MLPSFYCLGMVFFTGLPRATTNLKEFARCGLSLESLLLNKSRSVTLFVMEFGKLMKSGKPVSHHVVGTSYSPFLPSSRPHNPRVPLS